MDGTGVSKAPCPLPARSTAHYSIRRLLGRSMTGGRFGFFQAKGLPVSEAPVGGERGEAGALGEITDVQGVDMDHSYRVGLC